MKNFISSGILFFLASKGKNVHVKTCLQIFKQNDDDNNYNNNNNNINMLEKLDSKQDV